MKILNVNSLLDPVTGGGTAERTLQISLALMDAGIDCRILTTSIGFNDLLMDRLRGVGVTAYPCWFKRFHIPRASFSSVREAVEHVDLVHLMGHWSVLNAMVYIAARILRKPYVVCPAGALPIFGRSRLFKLIYNKIIGHRIIRNAHACIAVTEDERSQFASYGVDPATVVVIPNGINPDDFSKADVDSFRKQHGLSHHPFILFLGRLNPIKGPDILLEAFCHGHASWHGLHLVFAGPDGGMLNALKERAIAEGIQEKVHFIGFIGGAAKAAAYRSAELLAIPSRQEAMSIVVLEAGVSGIPVLLTDQCGFGAVERINGGIVTPATIDGVRDGLACMLDGKMDLVAIGKKLQDFVKSHYTWQVIIQNYLDLYTELLRTKV